MEEGILAGGKRGRELERYVLYSRRDRCVVTVRSEEVAEGFPCGGKRNGGPGCKGTRNSRNRRQPGKMGSQAA